MLIGMRDRLVRHCTQLINTIRGYAAEFGLIAAKDTYKIEALLARIATDQTLPQLARDLLALHGRQFAQLQVEIEKVEGLAWAPTNAVDAWRELRAWGRLVHR